MTDITALEKIQDYRFGSLIKGKHYAFARGLTINPTHLPAALDAMQADGYTLVSIFGQTDAQSIGFIFRIGGDDAPSLMTRRDIADIINENARLNERVQALLGANDDAVQRRRDADARARAAEEKLAQFRSGVPLGDIA